MIKRFPNADIGFFTKPDTDIETEMRHRFISVPNRL